MIKIVILMTIAATILSATCSNFPPSCFVSTTIATTRARQRLPFFFQTKKKNFALFASSSNANNENHGGYKYGYNQPLFHSIIHSGQQQQEHISNNNDNTDKTNNEIVKQEEKEEEHIIQQAFQHTHSLLLLQSSPSSTSTNNSPLYKDESISSINHAIVQQGLLYQKKSQTSSASYKNVEGVLRSNNQKVPGCIATVHLRTVLIPLSTASKNSKKSAAAEDYKVLLEGTADALLSRGLLALLSTSLSYEYEGRNAITAKQVLEIKGEKVSDYLGLRGVLSVGRNDGLKSMVEVIQHQIRGLLLLLLKMGDNEKKESEEKGAVVLEEETKVITTIEDTVEQQQQETTDQSVSSEQQKKPRVAMLLSGGVDSSVALNLLLRQNYNVTAFYLKIWLEDELSHLGQCPWEDDYLVCQQVCAQAPGGGVPLETLSLQEEYRDRVIRYTIEEAKKGRTPNPDVMCNSRIKFGVFYEEIVKKGLRGEFDFIASGHYAQLAEADDDDDELYEMEQVDETTTGDQIITTKRKRKRLLRAPDPIKDQSYFLSALTQEQLQHILFPIGQYHKSEVRDLATTEFNLPNQNRPDSQGLCFLGKVKFDDFLSSYLGTNPGAIVDAATGEVIGQHQGLWFHTIGQRKGIGKVLYPKVSNLGPWYIVAKDPERNVIYASNQYEEEVFEAARRDFCVEDVRWIAGYPPRYLKQEGGESEERRLLWKEGRFDMKIRHGPTIVQGTLRLTDGEDGTCGDIHLDKKDGGLAPGQFVAFYTLNGNECLGSGVISERHWANFLMDSEAVLSNVG